MCTTQCRQYVGEREEKTRKRLRGNSRATREEKNGELKKVKSTKDSGESSICPDIHNVELI